MRTKEGNKEKDILEAAVKVFAESGFHRSKISKIAELAKVATGSVYVYYENKYDILRKIFEKLWNRLHRELTTIADDKSLTPEEKVDLMIEKLVDTFTEEPELSIVFVNEQHTLLEGDDEMSVRYYTAYYKAMDRVFTEGIEKKVFNSNIDMRVFKDFMFGALRNIIHNQARKTLNVPVDKIKRSIQIMIKNGLKI